MKPRYALGFVLLVAALLTKMDSGKDRAPNFSIHTVSAEMTNAEVSAASASLFNNMTVSGPSSLEPEKPYILWTSYGKFIVVVGDQLEVDEKVVKSGDTTSKLVEVCGSPKNVTPINGAFENWHYNNRLVVRVEPVRKTIIEFVLAGV